MSNQIPIRLIIKEIMDEKKIKPAELAKRLGKQRQYVYDTIHKRETMTLSEIETWANGLGTTKQDILSRLEPKERFETKSISETDEIFVADPNYLMRQVRKLEDMLDFYKSQLIEKDNTIRVLLGKSEQVRYAGFAA
jgi:uncharacterized protein YfkK (UPF0435 family)